MGWFWGSSDDSSSNSNPSQDPLRDLDPSLRDFLKKESPVKYEPAAPTPSQAPEPKPSAPAPHSVENAKPRVPPESLFQDGRYAHLWESYRPLAEVEAEGKTDQQKVMDVLEGYNHRRAEIGRIALENCALEQLEVSDCFRTGGWAAKATMCRAENKKFERCYMMQSKFLKTLGYLSTLDRPPEVDEKIQMHADTLYHRMLEQEKAIEEAKVEGRPEPSFPPLLSAPKPKSTDDTPHKRRVAEISDLREKVQKPLLKKLEGLTGVERELEERAIKAEIEAATQAAEKLDVINREQAEERKKRQEQGRETITDKIRSYWNGK